MKELCREQVKSGETSLNGEILRKHEKNLSIGVHMQ